MPTNRGFTDHEQLDDVALIHMNGRVYDYQVGRFMSVDPVIQAPGNSQSVNPYSYIMNNPYSGTDPTGYAFETPWDALSIVYDVAKVGYGYATNNPQMVSNGLVDLAADTTALFVPGLPAGTTKVARGLDDIVNVGNGASKEVVKATKEKISDIGSKPSKSKLEVGKVESYQDSKKVTGDGTIDRDHMPSKGAAKMRAEELKGSPLTPKEAARVENAMPTMTVPKDVHKAGPTSGGKNTVSLMRSDSADLASAAARTPMLRLVTLKVWGTHNPLLIKLQMEPRKLKGQLISNMMIYLKSVYTKSANRL